MSAPVKQPSVSGGIGKAPAKQPSVGAGGFGKEPAKQPSVGGGGFGKEPAKQPSGFGLKKEASSSGIKENALTPQQEAEIRASFNKIDADKNGSISKDELRALLDETLHRKVSDKLFTSYLDLQFHATDKDFNKVIDFEEFKSLYSKIYINPELPISLKPKDGAFSPTLETGTSSPKVKRQENILTDQDVEDARAAFKKFDKDNSGTIDRNELKDLLTSSMSKKMAPGMVERFVDAQMQLADKDGSGTIDFDEFLGVYNKLVASNSPASPTSSPASPLGGMALPGMGIPGVAPRKR